MCIFSNRQKMQATDQTLRAACEPRHACNLRTAYTDEHFRRKKAGIPSAANFFSSYFFTGRHTFRPTAYFLPVTAGKHLTPPFSFFYIANLSLPAFSNIHFYKFLTSSNLFPVFPQLSTKKTEPSAQFFPLYISSIFPGLYNPQFSSCNTKPKCLRMPAKSGSLVLSSVITGLSFSSHSRLNSISLLPRPL